MRSRQDQEDCSVHQVQGQVLALPLHSLRQRHGEGRQAPPVPPPW